MASWTDNPGAGASAQDHNPDADNYWIFTTGQTVTGDLDASQLQGHTFNPTTEYRTNVTLRDGNEDGVISAKNGSDFHTNDGIIVDGQVYEYSRHWTYEATINYSDGTSIETRILASRLIDDPDRSQAAGDLHRQAILRFHDNQISTIFGGASGTGTYSLADIESITLGANLGNVHGRNITGAYNDAYPLLCFAGGSLIETSRGSVAVENLCPGDMVRTKGNGLQPIRWTGTRRLSATELETSPNLRPIRIKAGVLGENTPDSDLTVSPQHRILVRSKIAQRMFGSAEVLVAAKQMLEIDGIDIATDMAEVTYFHIMFDRHEIIISNGAETESLYAAGRQVLHALGPGAREEILALFPDLWKADAPADVYPAARVLVSGRKGCQLAHRHAKNRRPLIEPGKKFVRGNESTSARPCRRPA